MGDMAQREFENHIADVVEHDFGAEHIEEKCERCGRWNPVWFVDSDRFNAACARQEIVCPSCFIAAHEAATGMTSAWKLVPEMFRWIPLSDEVES